MEIIDPKKILLKIILILDRLNLDYFVTGGFAVSVWGRPRATFDIDIVIELVEPDAKDLMKALREIFKAGYIDEDAMKEAIKYQKEFNFIDSESGSKIDFWIKKDDELTVQKFKRRKLEKIQGQNVYFVSPEDLILSKLEWYQKSGSTRQLEDIESVLKISGDKLDMNYLNKWAKKLGVFKILNRLKKK